MGTQGSFMEEGSLTGTPTGTEWESSHRNGTRSCRVEVVLYCRTCVNKPLYEGHRLSNVSLEVEMNHSNTNCQHTYIVKTLINHRLHPDLFSHL